MQTILQLKKISNNAIEMTTIIIADKGQCTITCLYRPNLGNNWQFWETRIKDVSTISIKGGLNGYCAHCKKYLSVSQYFVFTNFVS